LALLKILALGDQDVEAGRLTPMDQVVARLRADRTGRVLRGRQLVKLRD
jgi:hypothetical protein